MLMYEKCYKNKVWLIDCVCGYVHGSAGSESPALWACVHAASAACWLSAAVCVGAQVQLLLSPVAVISELRGIISSLQLS